MQNSQTEEIKNRLNIVEIIGGYVKLKKTGANYRGICPFHSEKKPSFFVSPARQMWHCFGCGAGHSIFDFVMKIEGIEFGDALKILAQKAGVELKREDKRLASARQRLYEICELACLFFEKQLEGSASGKKAKEYLLGREIKGESIKKWRLGYSPNTWQGLSDFLVGKGYNREEIEKAGLAIKSEKSDSFYDRFRGRIIFPVFDLNSQVVGFGARVFEKIKPARNAFGIADAGGGEEEIAKYINTPQALLYDKSRLIYGLNFAKVAVRKQNQCVITEGYTDAIMAHQSGFENTVAASGTALTSFHLNILKRYTENLILAFDMDIAGDSATKRGIDLAQEQGFNIKIIKKTEADSESDSIENPRQGRDPADIISKNPKDWERAIKEARSILEFYFDLALAKYDKDSPEGKKSIAKIILPVIKRIPNKIEQSFWLQKLAKTLSVKEEDVLEELKKTKIEQNYFSPAQQDIVSETKPESSFLGTIGRKKILEEKIISLILKNPDNLNLIPLKHLPLFSGKVKNFLENLKKENLDKTSQGKEVSQKSLKKTISDLSSKYSDEADEELRNFLATLSLRAEIEYEEDAEEEIQICLSELRAIELKNKLNEITEQLKKAEEEKNSEKINKLMQEFNKLTKEL